MNTSTVQETVKTGPPGTGPHLVKNVCIFADTERHLFQKVAPGRKVAPGYKVPQDTIAHLAVVYFR